jgi:NAD-dependent SIR2 family protein deacetylase
MPIGITTALIAAGALGAGASAARGVGQARAAKKLFTEADAAELERLRERERTGEALTEQQRARLESASRIGQGAATRELEAMALQAAAAGARGPTSGRDIFLREQAKQSALRGVRQQQNLAVAEAEQAAEAANRARIDALREQQRQADIARIQGISEAVAGAAEAGAAAMSMQAQMKQQTAMLEAQLGKIEDAALFSELAPTSDAFSFELLPSM